MANALWKDRRLFQGRNYTYEYFEQKKYYFKVQTWLNTKDVYSWPF